jgi:hypothetical protein
VVEGEDLDAELPGLKIGKAAVAFFQEDIDRFRAFLQKAKGSAELDPTSLCIGAFQDLDDAQWEAAAKQFFGR